jgi:D-inositol-3-phosphate glycosyltransferase
VIGVIVGSPGSPGDEQYLAFLVSLVHQLDLEDRIHFVPFTEDKKSLFTGIDILASTSKREGFGRTIAEAMAAGCAVVARRAGGPETIIEHERTGLLVSGDDPVEFADSLRRIIGDSRFRESLVAAARNECLVKYDAGRVASSFCALFDECISGAV